MINLKTLFAGTYLLLITITFILGGTIQLILGVPNTFTTLFCIGLMFSFITIYSLFKGKLIFNSLTFLLVSYGLLIIVSGYLNATDFSKTVLYLIFFLLPLTTFLFFRINNKEQYITQLRLHKNFFFISCFQLPIMVLQDVLYPLIVKINQSNQYLSYADVKFGSLFLKADHALGLFMLMNIYILIKHNKNLKITRFPIFFIAYFGFTILYSESNISKLALLVLAGYYVYQIVPRKIKIIGFVAALILINISFDEITKIKAVNKEIYFVKHEYNVDKSYRNYERGIAKRPQVIITYINKLPWKIIGDGPYSYFNIFKGQFTKTKHFSQIIWTYADLGIIGTILLLFIIYGITTSFDLTRIEKMGVFTVLTVYSFMTTLLIDIGILITIFGMLYQTRKS